MTLSFLLLFFFFNDTATTEIYTLSLHDALPIFASGVGLRVGDAREAVHMQHTLAVDAHGRPENADLRSQGEVSEADRKSTRLNSSHLVISYAVFCLKKKNLCTQHSRRDTAASD